MAPRCARSSWSVSRRRGRHCLNGATAWNSSATRPPNNSSAKTRSAWRPRSGSMVNHRALTAALIDSRDFIAAKRRAETEPLLPSGPKIAFTGGMEFNDHMLIWDKLDKVHAKHPDMVLLHGGSPKGAERIAAAWADARKVTQIAYRPDWARHAKAAPFKRNDALLDGLPIGVMVFPGTGIQENLADKAKKTRYSGVDIRRWGRIAPVTT